MTLEEILAMIDALLANPEATPEEMASAIQEIREALAQLATGGEGEGEGEEEALSLDADQVTAVAEKLEELEGKMNDLKQKRDRAKSFLSSNAQKAKKGAQAKNRLPGGSSSTKGNDGSGKSIPASVARAKTKHYKSNEDAFMVGQFLRAITGKGNASAQRFLEERGFEFKVLESSNNSSAGILVPEQLEDAVIKLREEYGVARGLADVITLNMETYKTKKIVSGNTAYLINEGVAITTSEPVYQPLTLTPKLWGARTEMYSSFSEDAMINIVDEITEEHGRAHAIKEDEAFFNGDGTSTYGGIVGVCQKHRAILEDAGGTWTNDTHKGYLGSAVVASGTSWTAITDDDLSKMPARVQTLQGLNLAWHCNPVFYWEVMHPLAINAGGTTATEIVDGVPRQRFYGFPVIFNESMPSSTATDQVTLLFGDLRAGTMFADRRGLTMETDKVISTQVEEIVTTARWDVNVYHAGNYNATASARQRGTFASLITQNT